MLSSCLTGAVTVQDDLCVKTRINEEGKLEECEAEGAFH